MLKHVTTRLPHALCMYNSCVLLKVPLIHMGAKEPSSVPPHRGWFTIYHCNCAYSKLTVDDTSAG